MNYFWVRIFDYQYDPNKGWELEDKGTMLDEYYLQGESLTREEAKYQVTRRSSTDRFAKPKKKSGIYALVMDSDKFFFDRFFKEIDTFCFECGKPIKGKEAYFPKTHPRYYDENYSDHDGYFYFCSDECKYKSASKLRGSEGEFQNREDYETNGGIYGYVYHIYNRKEDKHYIGQSKYMPFFRWQEHAKQHIKGDLCDLIFETVAEVGIKSQDYLNSIEAWWIRKYIEEYGRDNVINVTVPKITVTHLVNRFNEMIAPYAEDGKMLGQFKMEV